MTAADQADLAPVAGEPSSPGPASGVRASDAEREDLVARLHQALGEGRLDLAETDARVAAAYAARYRGDLPGLVADLPNSPGANVGTPSWTAIWTSVVWRARTSVWGTDGAGRVPPTARQCRIAAVLTALAVVWVMGCGVLGAVLVGA